MSFFAAARHILRTSTQNVAVRSFSSKDFIPDHFEHATGKEKMELIAHQSGNMDPFEELAMKRGVGTKDQPNLVPSHREKRIIGCICEEGSTVINYMWVHKGEPKRCICGHWYKLVEKK